MLTDWMRAIRLRGSSCGRYPYYLGCRLSRETRRTRRQGAPAGLVACQSSPWARSGGGALIGASDIPEPWVQRDRVRSRRRHHGSCLVGPGIDWVRGAPRRVRDGRAPSQARYVLGGLDYFTGDTQRRSVGIAFVDGYWDDVPELRRVLVRRAALLAPGPERVGDHVGEAAVGPCCWRRTLTSPSPGPTSRRSSSPRRSAPLRLSPQPSE